MRVWECGAGGIFIDVNVVFTYLRPFRLLGLEGPVYRSCAKVFGQFVRLGLPRGGNCSRIMGVISSLDVSF